MKKNIILSIGLATAILTGCGSSSSNETKIGTGYYIDSAVSGVNYTCGSKSGKTGTDGSFTFEVGKDCTFSLGDMKLREVKADKLKDKIKIIEDNLAVATLLQTLDSDGDPNNDGIVISANILAELKAKNITALPTNQDEVAVIYEVIKMVDGYNGVLKTETEAQAHLDGEDGNKPDVLSLTDLLVEKTFYYKHNGGSRDTDGNSEEETCITSLLFNRNNKVTKSDECNIKYFTNDTLTNEENITRGPDDYTYAIVDNNITIDEEENTLTDQNNNSITFQNTGEDGVSTYILYSTKANAQTSQGQGSFVGGGGSSGGSTPAEPIE